MNRNDRNLRDGETWTEHFRTALGGYREPVPEELWNRIEKSLAAGEEKIHPAVRAELPLRRIRFRRRAAVSAAACLLLAAGIGLYRAAFPVPERRSSVPVLASVSPGPEESVSAGGEKAPGREERFPTADPGRSGKNPEFSGSLSEPEPGVRTRRNEARKITSLQSLPAVSDPLWARPVLVAGTPELFRTAPDGYSGGAPVSPEPDAAALRSSNTDAKTEPLRKSLKRMVAGSTVSGKKNGRAGIPEEEWGPGGTGNGRNRSAGEWSTGALLAGTGMISGETGTSGPYLKPAYSLNASQDIVQEPSDGELLFIQGSPYVKRKEDGDAYNHRQPLSFGISVGKELPHGFRVETGLLYTQLVSEVKRTIGTPVSYTQRVHYLGLPVRVTKNILEKRRFSLYWGAGALAEHSVYATAGGRRIQADGWQFSVFTAPGVQYRVGNRAGIYFEPGAAYYFDNGSSVRTIRQDTPLNFTMQLGFRFFY